MNWSELQDSLKEQAQDLLQKVQDSDITIFFQEKYEDLSPSAQTGVKIGFALTAVLFLFSFPYSSWQTSLEHMEQFQNRREALSVLTDSRLRLASQGTLSQGLTPDSLKSKIELEFKDERLISSQEAVAELGEPPKSLPQSLEGYAIEAKAKALNFRQVLRLAARFDQINESTFVQRLSIRESSTNPGYFDTALSVLHLFQKSETPTEDSGSRPSRSRGSR